MGFFSHLIWLDLKTPDLMHQSINNLFHLSISIIGKPHKCFNSVYVLERIIISGCPLNSNQKNDKKNDKFFSKKWKKMKKMSQKIPNPYKRQTQKSAAGGVFVQNRNLSISSIRHATVRVLRKTKISRCPKCN